MKKLDKKQIPQFAALCVLTLGVFGWFAMKMILPTPAAAQSGQLVQAAQRTAATVPAANNKPLAAAALAATPAGSIAPTPPTALRDPFAMAALNTPPAAPKPAPAVPMPPVRMASRLPAPPALPLPLGLGNFPVSAPNRATDNPVQRSSIAPLPVTLPAPSWTVTGVLQSDDESVAILRNGASRRIVRAGDMADSQFRVISVTRSSVVLGHAGQKYSLILGIAAPTVLSQPKLISEPNTLGAAPKEIPTSSSALLAPGTIAPDFTLSTVSGSPISLSSLRGHPVLIDFWATWCNPCQQSMPHIQSLHEEFGSSLIVLSVNTWDQLSAMQSFVQARPDYTTLMLHDTKADNVSTGKYLVTGIPTVYLIDKFGRVAAAYVSPTEATLRHALSALGIRPASLGVPALSAQKPAAHLRTATFVPKWVQFHWEAPYFAGNKS